MKTRNERLLPRLSSGFLSLAMILSALPALALRTPQPESPAQRAGLEESLQSEEDLLAFEIDLADRIKAEAGYTRKIRSEGHVNDEAVRGAVDHVRDRTVAILPLVRQYQDGDILTASPDELKPVGRVGAWLGPAGTLFVEGRIWREAPLELLLRAFEEKRFDLLEAWAAPSPTASEVKPASAATTSAPPEPTVPAPAPPAVSVSLPPPVPAAVEAPPAPPAPAQVRKEMAAAGQAAALGRLIPNQAVVLQTDNTGFTLWVDVSSSTLRGLSFVTMSGDPDPILLAPDPRGVPQKRVQTAARYQAKLGDAEVTEAMLKKHKNFRSFAERVRRGGVAGMLSDPKRRWVTGTLQELKQMLSRGGGALEAVRKLKPQEAEAVLQRVRELERHHRELARRVADGMRRLRSEAVDGRVPAGSLMEVLQSLAEVLAPWPRIQQEVLQSIQGIESSEDPWEKLEEHEDFIQRTILQVARDKDREALFGAASPDVLAAVYHDAFRAAWLGVIAEMEREAADAQEAALDDLAEEALRLATWVMGFERDAVISEVVVQKAALIGAEQMAPAYSLPAVGVLLLDPQGKVRRFIPGGGAFIRLGASSARYSPHRIADWHRPGDQIVLVYSSVTGLPNVEQLYNFAEDRFILENSENSLPGPPEVLLATVTAAGSVRIFRPQARPGDPAEWNQLWERILAEYGTYHKYDALLQEELRDPAVQHSMDDLADEAMSQVQRIAKSSGKVLLKTAGVRKLTEHLDPKVTWARNLAAGLPHLFQESLKQVYNAERAAELSADVNQWFSSEMASLQAEKRTEVLLQRTLALIQHAHSYIAERMGESLVGEAGPFVPVQIEGLTDPQPPQVKPAQPAGQPPGASAEPQPTPTPDEGPGAPAPAAEESTEERLARELSGLLQKVGKHPGDFPASQIEGIRSFAGEWVGERVKAGEKVRFIDFKKSWQQRQTRGDAYAGQVQEVAQRAERLLAQVSGVSTPRQVVHQMEETEQEITALPSQLTKFPNLTEPLEAVKKRLRTAQAFVEELRRMRAVLPGDSIQVKALLDSSRAMMAPLGAEGQEGKWKEALVKGRAELVGRVVEPVERSVTSLPKSTWSAKEIEQGNRLLETLPRLVALLRSDGSFEADAKRLEEYSPRIQAAIDKTKKDLERIDAGQAKVRNEETLAKSSSPPQIATILVTDERFSQFVTSDKDLGAFARKVSEGERSGYVVGLAHAVSTRMQNELKQKMGNYKSQAYRALLRVAELILEASSHHPAGLEEAVLANPPRVARRLRAQSARGAQNVVIFLPEGLFQPADRRRLDELALAGLGIELGRALAGMEGKTSRDAQVVLVTPDNIAVLQQQYAGWRIITVRRKTGSDPRSLALGALVAVLRDALEAGKPVFDVVVTHYLHLWDRTLEEALQELEADVSA